MEGAKDNTTMKKTYIEPKNTVVKLSLETMIAGSIDNTSIAGFEMGDDTAAGSITEADAREVIDIPDVWEEW